MLNKFKKVATTFKKTAIAAGVAGGVAILASATFVSAQMGMFSNFPIIGGAAYCSSTLQNGVCANTVGAGSALSGVVSTAMVPADTRQVGGNNQTQLVPLSLMVEYAAMRNFLGNGAFNMTQVNGTGTVTCATTSAATSAALSADRWVCDANVGSGAGRTAVVTSSPTPPTGFINEVKLFRTSGALTQPICMWQAVPTPQATQLQGQVVVLSANIAALAGLAADNGNLANLVIISGTGTDEGLAGSWTASPAITPAWTGITTVVNTQINLTTSFQRLFTTATIPTTATEVGVAICFTPTAAGAGATDGVAITGVQLEVGSVPSFYEVRSKQSEIAENEQFVYTLADTAGPIPVGLCTETAANTTAACWVQYPVPMYKTPVIAITNSGVGFAMPTTTAQTADTSACTVINNATFTYVQGTTGMYLQCTQAGTTAAVGISLPLTTLTAGTATKINAWTGL
jgi:hypothetical protein